MNPAVNCAVDYATQKDYETYLIYDGLRGLIADNIVPATRELVSGMPHYGGARIKHDTANGRRFVIAIVAEGTKMGDYLIRWINDSIGMEAHTSVLGHIQSGGSPTVLDRVMAYKLAVAAVDALDAGQTNSIMIYQDGAYGHLPIHTIAGSK